MHEKMYGYNERGGTNYFRQGDCTPTKTLRQLRPSGTKPGESMELASLLYSSSVSVFFLLLFPVISVSFFYLFPILFSFLFFLSLSISHLLPLSNYICDLQCHVSLAIVVMFALYTTIKAIEKQQEEDFSLAQAQYPTGDRAVC